MRFQVVRTAMLLIIALICLSPVFAAVPGGFTDVAVDDAGVKAAAEFAVKERAKTEPTISLDKITKASRQVVAGMNYDLDTQRDRGDGKENCRGSRLGQARSDA